VVPTTFTLLPLASCTAGRLLTLTLLPEAMATVGVPLIATCPATVVVPCADVGTGLAVEFTTLTECTSDWAGADFVSISHPLTRGLAMRCRGEIMEAVLLAMLERAMGILEPMARDPEHGEARSALACSHIWIGELLARAGNRSRALANYRKGVADFLTVVTLLPWDRYLRSSLAAGHAKAGTVLARMGSLSEAAAEYQSALEIAKPLALAKSHNVLPWYTIADAYSGLGDLSRVATVRSRGDPTNEQQRWTEACALYRSFVSLAMEGSAVS
jgi:hypothetical protein